MSTSLYLKFASELSAKTSLRSKGMMPPIDPITGDEPFASMGYLEDTRFDISLCGGDGIYRKQVGTETRNVEGLGDIEVPIFEAQPGFHLQILWHSDEIPPPRFGTARIYPETPSQIFAE